MTTTFSPLAQEWLDTFTRKIMPSSVWKKGIMGIAGTWSGGLVPNFMHAVLGCHTKIKSVNFDNIAF
ncbi:hypothetical protein L218DRAFT_1010544 [Marasmius fiardii PR-910]|nr:hypothetical protein L218DRAFT_1010544 [Marasmius fiardii PR-910]